MYEEQETENNNNNNNNKHVNSRKKLFTRTNSIQNDLSPSIDDLDFNNIELMSGKTPEDIEEKCLALCKDYLSGNWSEQTTKTIQVRRITGGFVNQIYYCGIREPNTSESVPQEVVIRLYGVLQFTFDESDKSRIRDMVISQVFSEKGMGPKVYGMFEGGQIQKYYKHRQFIGEDQQNDKLVEKVFRSLARIHSWNLPLKRNENFFLEMMEKSLNEAFIKNPFNDLIQKYNCETLKKYDLKSELQWIRTAVKECGSPVMFTHNDFRSSNILITEPNDELVICDYDMSGYGYRGYDFVSLMKEWGRNQFDFKTIDGILLGSEFKPYIEIYIDECERIYGKSYSENPINSVEHILRETKIFLLFLYLFFTLLILSGLPDNGKPDNEKKPPNYKLLMEFVELNYKNYHIIKEKFRENKVFE